VGGVTPSLGLIAARLSEQANGEAGVTTSPSEVRVGSRLCEKSKVRSATRMIFLISISKLNALAMWAHEKPLNE
jgi:hypothetical protein